MTQIFIRKDIKVECEPQINTLWFMQPKTPLDESNALFKDAERIRDEIRRHCDNANPRITYTTVRACEFCGDESDWKGEPAECCEESVEQLADCGLSLKGAK